MLRFFCLAALFLTVALPASAAETSRVCAVAAWDCIGAIEIRVGEQAFRMSKYANDEMLAEIGDGSASKRFLVAQPSGAELYLGLSAQEVSNPAANPFGFFDYAFAMPVAALRLAFPSGPSSVPAAALQRDVLVEGNPVSVHASKGRDGRIEFWVEGVPLGRVSGHINASLLPPLDGKYPLGAWLHKSGTHFNTLSDARRAPRQ